MMKVPLLDLRAQYDEIRLEVRAAIDRVCDTQRFILGPEVAALEEEIGQYSGAQFALGVSSGTDALLISLMAIGIDPGDEVITSTFSFFATAGVIARLHARPIFVDIERDTFNLDPDDVAAKWTKRTKAIIPVHLFGRCASMTPLLELTNRRGVHVIEDAAQAIGASDDLGRLAGSSGSMGCFSFFPSKNLGGFGDGGMVVTNDAGLLESLRTLRVHGAKPKYHHRMIGGNFRLDALQAAVLRVKLKYLSQWTLKRRDNAERYRRLFSEASLLGKITPPADSPGHIYNQFVIRCRERDELQTYLREQGIETEVYYPIPLHKQECFLETGDVAMPNAELAAREALALPVYPELTGPQQEYVVDTIQRFYNRVYTSGTMAR